MSIYRLNSQNGTQQSTRQRRRLRFIQRQQREPCGIFLQERSYGATSFTSGAETISYSTTLQPAKHKGGGNEGAEASTTTMNCKYWVKRRPNNRMKTGLWHQAWEQQLYRDGRKRTPLWKINGPGGWWSWWQDRFRPCRGQSRARWLGRQGGERGAKGRAVEDKAIESTPMSLPPQKLGKHGRTLQVNCRLLQRSPWELRCLRRRQPTGPREETAAAGPSDEPAEPDVDNLDGDETNWGEKNSNKGQSFLEYFHLSVCPHWLSIKWHQARRENK